MRILQRRVRRNKPTIVQLEDGTWVEESEIGAMPGARCAAYTLSGGRCTRTASDGDYCAQHADGGDDSAGISEVDGQAGEPDEGV